jgi:uncharacterized membrane protein (UPF0127 family)
MEIEFEFKGKQIVLDGEVCTGWKKAKGLMFRKDNRPMIFLFKKPTHMAIHSWFCRRFLAIWFRKGRIVDVKIVRPWACCVRPRNAFDLLIEIPFSSEKQIREFLDGSKKTI